MNDRYFDADDLMEPQPDTNSMFLVDRHINIETVDDFLDIEGVAYRDMRMLEDPADYESIGGRRDLEFTVRGFMITPFPYLAQLGPLPVANAYKGDCLFDVAWEGELTAVEAKPRYEESLQIIEDLFPKDQAIFLICGGGGYAAMMRSFLEVLGWDPEKIYVLGGAWKYSGPNAVPVVVHNPDGTKHVDTSNVEMICIDFGALTRIK